MCQKSDESDIKFLYHLRFYLFLVNFLETNTNITVYLKGINAGARDYDKRYCFIVHSLKIQLLKLLNYFYGSYMMNLQSIRSNISTV